MTEEGQVPEVTSLNVGVQN